MIRPRRVSQSGNFILMGSLIGGSVRTQDGEKVGQLEEIIFDADTGEVAYAVLSFIGRLSLGDRLIVVPWRRLQMDPHNRCLIVEMDKEVMALAPWFRRGDWPDMTDPAWKNEIVGFYRKAFVKRGNAIPA